jgi:hypothetical protein
MVDKNRILELHGLQKSNFRIDDDRQNLIFEIDDY